MATKKTAAKTSGQQAKGTEVVSWADELARRAAVAKIQAVSTGGSSKGIGTAGGVFSIDGADAGTVLNVIILDSILETTYYGEKYDPDNKKSPLAFAFGRVKKELRWHEDSEEFAGELCDDSEFTKFGSAENGKGKAAKEIVRMLVIDESDLDDIEASEPRILKVPVTSVKYHSGYVKGITDVKNSDPIAVLTEVSLHRHPKFQFEMKFRSLGDVDEELIGALLDKARAHESDLFQPYSKREEEDEAPAGRGAGKAQARSASPAKPTAKARR